MKQQRLLVKKKARSGKKMRLEYLRQEQGVMELVVAKTIVMLG